MGMSSLCATLSHSLSHPFIPTPHPTPTNFPYILSSRLLQTLSLVFFPFPGKNLRSKVWGIRQAWMMDNWPSIMTKHPQTTPRTTSRLPHVVCHTNPTLHSQLTSIARRRCSRQFESEGGAAPCTSCPRESGWLCLGIDLQSLEGGLDCGGSYWRGEWCQNTQCAPRPRPCTSQQGATVHTTTFFVPPIKN